MSDETADLQAQVAALRDRVDALERRVGASQQPAAGGQDDENDDSVAFPVPGPGG